METGSNRSGGVIFLPMAGALAATDWRAPFWLYAAAILIVPSAYLTLHDTVRARGSSTELAAITGLRRKGGFGIYAITLVATLVFYMAAPLPFLLERFDAGPALTGTVIAVSTLSSMAGALAVPAVRGRMNQAMIIAVVQGGGPAEVDAAVEAAHAAFEDDWRWRTAADRAALLLRGADLLEAHAGNGHTSSP